jgi:hypothetical protein
VATVLQQSPSTPIPKDVDADVERKKWLIDIIIGSIIQAPLSIAPYLYAVIASASPVSKNQFSKIIHLAIVFVIDFFHMNIPNIASQINDVNVERSPTIG